MAEMADNAGTAIVVGTGPGLGSALVRRFARAGMKVAAARRNAGELEGLTKELGAAVRPYSCDAINELAVQQLLSSATKDLGPVRLVVYNAGGSARKGVLETTAAEFERYWKNACLGGFLVGREAVRAMLAQDAGGHHRGTIIFTGATGALRGSANFLNMAVGKFGLRALAQSMAREFQPQGIHVAHVVIDGRSRAIVRTKPGGARRACRPLAGRHRGIVLPAAPAKPERVDAGARSQALRGEVLRTGQG
jgi:NAD(P)-dependent dehydrogenase (short-subunit alcohol dehydrogenase family)